MSIEPYQWLVEHADELGYKKENCGPASVDLCLGDVRQYMESKSGFSINPILLPIFWNGCFYLCSTAEYIKVPATHCATINMRSSWARKGMGHKMAGFIDPGFEGQVTLELETSITLSIPRGERIVQLIYHRLTEATEKPYTGKYKGQTGPTEAYK